jgi:hypothetical protein
MSGTEMSELSSDSNPLHIGFKIMCVMDPRMRHPLSEIRQWIHQDWHPARVPRDLAQSLLKNSGTKGFIYRCKDVLNDENDGWETEEEGVSVIMHEWVGSLVLLSAINNSC